ncbi:sensor histidine kinase [Desulfosporosinus sp. OT]|uniref:sensor histidine kinase n=1 Tax=Desulfosporosinus sp. OT TaxID=913865 RepID=UPI000223A67E|nr:sensor histidine kinase [Desulfosporosinus sp. OT]EGW36401.1 histidine kinase-, DNA gyrase B-, and HSP90-like ATPase family protein [Desulfosporosinus sp. OT]
MFWRLLQDLALNIGLIVTVAYLMTRTKLFRRMLRSKANTQEKVFLVLLFGIIGIAGTYTGVNIKGALANSRVIGVAVGGLLGGPLVGLCAGVLAGVHRTLLGGFTAGACGIATIVEGSIAGYMGRKFSGDLTWKRSLFVGMGIEVIQMLVILLIARPYYAAWDLVQDIGLPMIIMNGVGISIFVSVIHNSLEEEERIGAVQAQKALYIANLTLPILRLGLNKDTARSVAQIIHEQTDVAAVALTDRDQILAHVGKGFDHHEAGHAIQTLATHQALDSGELKLAATRAEIGCAEPNCPLFSALVVPLHIQHSVVGTLKIYREQARGISPVDWEFGAGLGMLFSTQLELATLETHACLVRRSELKALQAQVNPHFLFNALNTVVSFCRTDPEKARNLLLQLGDFFRKNLKSGEKFVTLREECEHIRAYLAIEQARFSDRLCVREEITDDALNWRLPGLTLQPLVENAIKHGIYPMSTLGEILISALVEEEILVVRIWDNGVGIPAEKLALIHAGVEVSTSGLGIGLQNVAQRLQILYGKRADFVITSKAGAGTEVTLKLPAAAAAERI